MSRIEVHMPLPSESAIGNGLRLLTRRIHEAGLADGEPGGFFGGSWGYGANYENATFMLHRYCWCDSQECPWCAGCECPASLWRGGKKSADKSKWCRVCRGDFGSAPNFLHKPSGSTVEWYKYIGRGMKIDLKAKWIAIMRDCLASLEPRQ